MWEYYYEDLLPGRKGRERLNDLGSDGWEMVGIDGHRMFFKRLKHDPQPKVGTVKKARKRAAA